MDELSPAAAGTYWTIAASAIRTDAITRPAPIDITAVADSIRIISVLICSAVIDPLREAFRLRSTGKRLQHLCQGRGATCAAT